VLMDIMTAILNSALSQVFLGDHQQPWTGPGATRCMAAAIEPVLQAHPFLRNVWTMHRRIIISRLTRSMYHGLVTALKEATVEYVAHGNYVELLEAKGGQDAQAVLDCARDAQLKSGRKMNELARRRTLLGYVIRCFA
jgi:hypothetical protein